MSQKANTKLIGLFVLGGGILLLAAVLLFGSGKYFRNTLDCVMFFEGSVGGLDVGAPVEFRGVSIGTVTDIRLVYDPDEDQLLIPVEVALDPTRIENIGVISNSDTGEHLAKHIELGLRAQLASQSFVTGKLKIILEYRPEYPVVLAGMSPDLFEIPTMPNKLQQLATRLGELPIENIVKRTDDVMAGLSDLVAKGVIESAVTNLNAAAAATSELINELKAVTKSIQPDDVGGLMTDLRETVRQTSDMLSSPELATLVTNLQETLISAQALIDRMGEGVNPVQARTLETIEELRLTLETARLTFDYIQRHPESLLKGKEP